MNIKKQIEELERIAEGEGTSLTGLFHTIVDGQKTAKQALKIIKKLQEVIDYALSELSSFRITADVVGARTVCATADSKQDAVKKIKEMMGE